MNFLGITYLVLEVDVSEIVHCSDKRLGFRVRGPVGLATHTSEP